MSASQRSSSKLPAVYGITDGQARIELLHKEVPLLLKAGFLVQIREPSLSNRECFHLLEGILEGLALEERSKLLINDRLDVALCFDGPGVHLPESGFPIALARKMLGPNRLLGASCHASSRLQAATREGADFATLSPIFASPGKGPALGVEGASKIFLPPDLPVYALGGMHAENLNSLPKLGFQGIAAIRAVFAGETPVANARRLQSAWDRSSNGF